jgi:hypothetical protein
MAADSDRVTITDAIDRLRHELQVAACKAQGSGPDGLKFRITSIELELTVVAEDSASAGGEIGWWIFKGKADLASKDVVTHKVRLTLDVGDLRVHSPTGTG